MAIKDNQSILTRRLSFDSAVNSAYSKYTTLMVERNQLALSHRSFDVETAQTSPFMRMLPKEQTDTIYDFYFPFTPVNITYDNLSDEVAEIPRPGTVPIIAFKSHRLMRISFEFLVAVPLDGLIYDVEESLDLLRTMSTNSQRGVIFFNSDNFLMGLKKYRNNSQIIRLYNNAIFTIAEMSVTSTRRNEYGRITSATVNITLVENQNPKVSVVKILPFTKSIPKKKIPKTTTTKPKTYPKRSTENNTLVDKSQVDNGVVATE